MSKNLGTFGQDLFFYMFEHVEIFTRLALKVLVFSKTNMNYTISHYWEVLLLSFYEILHFLKSTVYLFTSLSFFSCNKKKVQGWTQFEDRSGHANIWFFFRPY